MPRSALFLVWTHYDLVALILKNWWTMNIYNSTWSQKEERRTTGEIQVRSQHNNNIAHFYFRSSISHRHSPLLDSMDNALFQSDSRNRPQKFAAGQSGCAYKLQLSDPNPTQMLSSFSLQQRKTAPYRGSGDNWWFLSLHPIGTIPYGHISEAKLYLLCPANNEQYTSALSHDPWRMRYAGCLLCDFFTPVRLGNSYTHFHVNWAGLEPLLLHRGS